MADECGFFADVDSFDFFLFPFDDFDLFSVLGDGFSKFFEFFRVIWCWCGCGLCWFFGDDSFEIDDVFLGFF